MARFFTKSDEMKLEKELKTVYSSEELKEFVAKAIVERGLLTLASGGSPTIERERAKMLKRLERLQRVAQDKLKKVM